MIRLFRDNHPFLLLLLFLYLLVLYLVHFISTSVAPHFEPVDPFTNLVSNFLNWLPFSAQKISQLFALILLFAEALYFNYLLNKYKLVSQNNFLPAFTYILFSSLFTDWTFYSPSLIRNMVLLVLFNQLFSVYKKEKVMSHIFNIGFTLAIAVLFDRDTWVFILFVLGGLLIIRPFHPREWSILIMGIFVPLFITGVYFFWFDSWIPYLQHFFVQFHIPSVPDKNIRTELLVKTGILTCILLFALLKIVEQSGKAVVQTRKYYTVMGLFFIAGLPDVLLNTGWSTQDLYWTIIPFSFIVSVWFSELKRLWIAEVFHLSLLLAILWYQYANRIIL